MSPLGHPRTNIIAWSQFISIPNGVCAFLGRPARLPMMATDFPASNQWYDTSSHVLMQNRLLLTRA
jgi:hypothetical protein